MKKLLAIILALVLCVGFAACGKKTEAPEVQQGETQPEPQPQQTAPAAAAYTTGDYTKALAAELAKLAKGPFRMGMKTKMDMGDGNAADVDMILYIDGEERMAADIVYGGENMRVVFKDGEGYLLFDSEKTAIKTGDIDIDDSLSEVNDITEESADAQYIGGTEEINGTTYVFEQVKGDEDATMYYEQGTGVWKYMRAESDGEVILTEITAYDGDVDASVFDIPADYEIMDLSDLAA